MCAQTECQQFNQLEHFPALYTAAPVRFLLADAYKTKGLTALQIMVPPEGTSQNYFIST
jgi:hypothetical protein